MPDQKPPAKQEIQKVAPITSWLSQDKVRAALKRALPDHLTPENFIQIAITTVQRNPALLECTPLSIVGAVIEASQLGLSLDPSLGQAYLVPFKNNKNGGRREAMMMPGYRGMVHLARNTGIVKSVSAEVVRKDEVFQVEYGLIRQLRHVPNFELKDREKEASWIGAYAVAIYADGSEPDFIYLTREKVMAAKSRSKAAESGPWVTDPEEMWKKTAIRRLAKLLPQSPKMLNLHRAAGRDEAIESDLPIESLVDLTELQAVAEETQANAAEAPKRKSEKALEMPTAQTSLTEGKTAPAETKQQNGGTKTAPAETKQADDDTLSPDQIKSAQTLAMSNGWALVDLKTYLHKKYGSEHLKDLRVSQLQALEYVLINGTAAVETAEEQTQQ